MPATSSDMTLVPLLVHALSPHGDGLAEWQGKPVHIAKTVPGDEVRVALHPMKDYLRGQVLEIVRPSPERVEPACRHFQDCGGCQLQALSPRDYLNHKQQQLQQQLQPLAQHPPQSGIPVHHLLTVPHASRRRVEWRLWQQAGRWQVGYQAFRSHAGVSITECPVLEPALQKLMWALPQALAALPLACQPQSAQATLLDTGLELILRGETIDCASQNQHIWGVWAAQIKVQRLIWEGGIAPARYLLHTEGTPAMQLGDYSVPVPPGAFLQAARMGQMILTQEVLKICGESRLVADVFSGIGTYSFPLLAQAQHVDALEGDMEMVKAVHSAIRQHGLKKRLTAQWRDLFAKPLTVEELNRYDAVVLNPPRAGAGNQCRQLARSGVPTIAYVSCNPERFVRDASLLLAGGYQLRSVQPIDQFVWSHHLELVAHFSR